MRDGERRQRRWMLAGSIATGVAVLIGIAIYFVVSSNSVPVGDQRAIDAIEAAGMHDVILGGTDKLACADSESSRHFSGINSTGTHVEGTVCCGLTGIGKGCTLRWGR